jgi:hypothetical protein
LIQIFLSLARQKRIKMNIQLAVEIGERRKKVKDGKGESARNY